MGQWFRPIRVVLPALLRASTSRPQPPRCVPRSPGSLLAPVWALHCGIPRSAPGDGAGGPQGSVGGRPWADRDPTVRVLLATSPGGARRLAPRPGLSLSYAQCLPFLCLGRWTNFMLSTHCLPMPRPGYRSTTTSHYLTRMPHGSICSLHQTARRLRRVGAWHSCLSTNTIIRPQRPPRPPLRVPPKVFRWPPSQRPMPHQDLRQHFASTKCEGLNPYTGLPTR